MYSPLYYAVENLKYDAVKIILELGGNPREDFGWGCTVFRALVCVSPREGREKEDLGMRYEIAKLLVEHKATLNKHDLYVALHSGSCDKSLLEFFSHLIYTEDNFSHGAPPIVTVVKCGYDLDFIDHFLTLTKNVNEYDWEGHNALSYAKWRKNGELVQLLKQHGAKDLDDESNSIPYLSL